MTTITCEASPWGTLKDGTPVHRITLRDAHGAQAVLSNLGATLVRWDAADRDGRFDNIVLGFATPQAYLDSSTHMGGTIGRFANRIAGAHFTLDGQDYRLEANDGANTLHGGHDGFDRRLWDYSLAPDSGSVLFTLHSPDGDSGFPGALTLQVRYTFDGTAIRIDYDAQCAAPTAFNVTNHSYFNLSGLRGRATGANAASDTASKPLLEDTPDDGTILDHVVRIDAEQVLLPDVHGIPQQQVSVAGTVFDLRDGATVGARLASRDPALVAMQGYDHCYVLSPPDRIETPLRDVAAAFHPHSGRRLTIATTERTVQFYTASNLRGVVDGAGHALRAHDAVCFETQAQPNQINTADAQGVTLRPAQRYRQTTVYRCQAEN
ncbi:aldose epimerase family protein [Robbsia sp. KACC 23696]|uniref:aldose epimerase family protein n=1 Tax=Robbsia sp. KACC 23696 TaxID=3149231 RepID=UPI00325A9EC9